MDKGSTSASFSVRGRERNNLVVRNYFGLNEIGQNYEYLDTNILIYGEISKCCSIFQEYQDLSVFLNGSNTMHKISACAFILMRGRESNNLVVRNYLD